MDTEEYLKKQMAEQEARRRSRWYGVRLTAAEAARLEAVANAHFNGSVSNAIRYALATMEVKDNE
jgi:hypothetical protein